MNYFYDGQFKNVLSQIQRTFNGFKYMTGLNRTGKAEMLSVPCMVGTQSRMVGAISRKNSENVALTAPFISVWMSNVSVDRSRSGPASHVNKLFIQEKKFDYETNQYLNEMGNSYEVDRIMPVPFNVEVQVDIWTTNEEMKAQILEQILILFNPSIDLQKNENALDWTNNMMLELVSINYSSRNVPIGDDTAMEITSLVFQLQNFYLNPPAKVKRQQIINTITNDDPLDNEDQDIWMNALNVDFVTTYKNSKITVVDGTAELFTFSGDVDWDELFTNQNLQFHPDGVYKLKLKPNYGFEFLTAPIILNIVGRTTDPKKLAIEVNQNSLPSATMLPIDAVIDPRTYYPDTGLNPVQPLNPGNVPGKRYLILHDIHPNTESWGALGAYAGSIIQTDDGINYHVDFSSTENDLGQIVRNADDGQLYIRITEEHWVDVFQGTYNPGYWRLVSILGNNQGV